MGLNVSINLFYFCNVSNFISIVYVHHLLFTCFYVLITLVTIDVHNLVFSCFLYAYNFIITMHTCTPFSIYMFDFIIFKESFTIIDIYESVQRVLFLFTPSPSPKGYSKMLIFFSKS